MRRLPAVRSSGSTRSSASRASLHTKAALLPRSLSTQGFGRLRPETTTTTVASHEAGRASTCYATVTFRTDSRTTVRSPEVAPWASKRTFDSVSSTSSMPWTVA